jgi:hypothetical protein
VEVQAQIRLVAVTVIAGRRVGAVRLVCFVVDLIHIPGNVAAQWERRRRRRRVAGVPVIGDSFVKRTFASTRLLAIVAHMRDCVPERTVNDDSFTRLDVDGIVIVFAGTLG